MSQSSAVVISCGYNLRTLKHTGLCPECARPVQQSLSALDERPWLRPIRRGIIILIIYEVCGLLYLGTWQILRTLTITLQTRVSLNQALFTVSIPLSILWCVGIFLCTRSSPQSTIHEKTSLLRIIARCSAVLVLLVDFTQQAGNWNLYPGTIGTFYTLMGMSMVLRTTSVIGFAPYLAMLIARWQVSLRGWATTWVALMLLRTGTTLTSSIAYYCYYANRSPGTPMGTLAIPPHMRGLLATIGHMSLVLTVTAALAGLVLLWKCRAMLNRALTQPSSA